MDDVTKRLIEAGLQAPGAQPSNGEPMVEVGVDGKKMMVAASQGIYMAVSNMNAMTQQVLLLLNGIHHHLAARAHPKSQEHAGCPVCVAIAEAVGRALEQQFGSDESIPDPEGDAKADVERAMAAEEWAAAAEESQEEDV